MGSKKSGRGENIGRTMSGGGEKERGGTKVEGHRRREKEQK